MTSKPVVYLVNIGRDEYITKKNKWLPKILKWINENGGGPMVPYSADFEKEVMQIAGSPDKEARDKAFDLINEAGYSKKLNYVPITRNFKNVAKFVVDTNHFDPFYSGLYFTDDWDVVGSPLPETSNPHILSIFSRVHPDRSGQPNIYLETRLSIDKEKVKIELYEGSTLISTTTKTGIIPSGSYYLVTNYQDNKQNVQLYKGKENFIDSLYFETGKRSIQNNWLSGSGTAIGGYTSGYGYSGYQFKPQYGNLYIDYIYSQDVVLAEYESKSFESNLPLDAATLFPTGNSDTELLSLGQDGFEKVVSSDNFQKGRNEVGSLATDVIVSNDSFNTYENQATSSIKVTKTKNSQISSIQYGEVLRIPNFSNLTFKAKLKYEDALKDGKFKIVFWDSSRKRIAFIQEIQNITPNQWNVLEIPLIADSLYNDRLVLEIGHFGNVSQEGSFWLQDPSLTTESVEWALSNNDGLQYIPVLTAISDQYKSVNFSNNNFYSTVIKNDPKLFYTFDDANDTSHIFGSTTNFKINNQYPHSGTVNSGSALPVTSAGSAPSFVYPIVMPNTVQTFTAGQTYTIPKCVNSLNRDNFIGLYGLGRLQTNTVSGFSNSDMSYSVWFYADHDQYSRSLGQSGGTSSYDWKLSLLGGTAGGPLLSFVSGTGTVTASVPSTNGNATWADKNWHQVSFTYDSSYFKLYYDGNLVSVKESSAFSIPTFTGPFYVLGPEGGGTAQVPTLSNGIYTIDTSVPFTWINSIIAYNKVLTEDQINEQYLAAISKYNKLRVRARAYTKDAWISGYELIPKYAHLGRLLDKEGQISNQIKFDVGRLDFAAFSDV
jgi:hypothetical protein